MDRITTVVEALKQQDLPDNRTYLTLDIVVEYCVQHNGQFPSYRTIGTILGRLIGKDKPICPSVIQHYLLELEYNKRLERIGKNWTIRGGKYIL